MDYSDLFLSEGGAGLSYEVEGCNSDPHDTMLSAAENIS